MDSIRFLRGLRRRWYILPIVCVVAVLASGLAWGPGKPAVGRYQAVSTLVRSPSAPKDFTMTRAALYITTTDVPVRAAKAIGYTGDPQTLAAKLAIASNDKIGSLTITDTGSDAVQVAGIVNGFAAALVGYLKDSDAAQRTQVMAATQTQLDGIKAQLRVLDGQIFAKLPKVDSALVAERAALAGRFSTLSKDLDAQVAAADQPPAAVPLQPARATAAGASGFAVLNHTSTRLGLAALIGLLLGLALIYLIERFDTRLRDRNDVEEESGVPVLAEAPRLPRARRTPGVEILRQPGSAAAEAYRGLRASVLLAADANLPGVRGRLGSQPVEPYVLLVVSGSEGEGRTSTVVNLAACLAESGRSVLVLDCDFRNPQTHRYFDRPHGRGLSDLIAAGLDGELANLAGPTSVGGVRLASSGVSVGQPAALLSRMGGLIAEARHLADVVIIDSPPVLESNDAVDLIRHVDGLLLVVRIGRTTVGHAVRTTQLLRRSGATPIGALQINSSSRTAGGTRRWRFSRSNRPSRPVGAHTPDATATTPQKADGISIASSEASLPASGA
jgi:Mrp family chromosome partitioning ATPase